jgi:hypothetical protein
MGDFKMKPLLENLQSTPYKYLTAGEIIKIIKENTTKEERISLVRNIKREPYILSENDNSEFLIVVDYILDQLIKD